MDDVTQDDDLRLYILMRTDLASMTPGKACAHAAHAANQFIHECGDEVMRAARLIKQVQAWQSQTPLGFGTTITLGVTGAQLAMAVEVAKAMGLLAGVVHDPTYPLVDTAPDSKTSVVHKIPLDTCGYIFGDAKLVSALTKAMHLGLMP